jgi:hypothetical protein
MLGKSVSMHVLLSYNSPAVTADLSNWAGKYQAQHVMVSASSQVRIPFWHLQHALPYCKRASIYLSPAAAPKPKNHLE